MPDGLGRPTTSIHASCSRESWCFRPQTEPPRHRQRDHASDGKNRRQQLAATSLHPLHLFNTQIQIPAKRAACEGHFEVEAFCCELCHCGASLEGQRVIEVELECIRGQIDLLVQNQPLKSRMQKIHGHEQGYLLPLALVPEIAGALQLDLLRGTLQKVQRVEKASFPTLSVIPDGRRHPVGAVEAGHGLELALELIFVFANDVQDVLFSVGHDLVRVRIESDTEVPGILVCRVVLPSVLATREIVDGACAAAFNEPASDHSPRSGTLGWSNLEMPFQDLPLTIHQRAVVWTRG